MNNLTLGLLFVVIALGAPHAGAAPLPKVPKASAPKPAVATGATKPATAAALPATASPRALPAAKSPAATRSYPVSSNLSTTPPTDLSLAVAISKALKKSPSMTIATLKIEDSRQRLEAERRNILPKFTLSANVMRWDSALQFSLGTPTTTTPPADCPIGCLTFLGELFGSFDMGNLRDIYTQQYTVQVAQPITGAFAILQMIKARKIDVKVAELEQQLSAHEARYKTIAAYIQALQAMEYLKITRKSEALIRQHLKRAQLFYKADVLSKSEVLKLNSALGNAIQSRLQAESGVTLSLDVLKMHMGETGNANYRLTNTFPAPKQLLTLTARQAFALMEESRPELLQLKRRREMIQLSHKASRIMLLPSASVIAQYQHNEGMGTMQPKNSWFVGINISWTWEWNKKHLESDLILSQVQQLDATVKQIRLGLRLNVKSHLLAVKTAWNKIAIARIAIKEAAEGLRLEELRFGAKLKTSVSLLDAQTRYDGAQISLTNSIYEYYKSVASLMQAMGVKTLKRSAIPW